MAIKRRIPDTFFTISFINEYTSISIDCSLKKVREKKNDARLQISRLPTYQVFVFVYFAKFIGRFALSCDRWGEYVCTGS